MRQQAAAYETTCTNCHQQCKGWAVQLISESKLRWELDWSCDHCGIEADGGDWGPAPEDVRNRLIAEHGTDCIRGSDSEKRMGKILKAFRDAFGGSMQEAKKSATEFTTTGWRGTHIEATLVTDFLRNSGVDVKKCDSGSL